MAPSPSLVEGRRAHAIAVGTAAPSQSFIYALGGEASVNAGRKDSVERASISAFGQIGSWTLDVQDALPTPLSYHKAEVIGQYIYVVGMFSLCLLLSFHYRLSHQPSFIFPQLTLVLRRKDQHWCPWRNLPCQNFGSIGCCYFGHWNHS